MRSEPRKSPRRSSRSVGLSTICLPATPSAGTSLALAAAASALCQGIDAVVRTETADVQNARRFMVTTPGYVSARRGYTSQSGSRYARRLRFFTAAVRAGAAAAAGSGGARNGTGEDWTMDVV